MSYWELSEVYNAYKTKLPKTQKTLHSTLQQTLSMLVPSSTVTGWEMQGPLLFRCIAVAPCCRVDSRFPLEIYKVFCYYILLSQEAMKNFSLKHTEASSAKTEQAKRCTNNFCIAAKIPITLHHLVLPACGCECLSAVLHIHTTETI